MSRTLYRKYRSQTFEELVGQTSVTQILRNAIRRSRISHAYLFCGPRGTGKTSVARIFAKALCCLDPQDGDCCGRCVNCEAIATGNAVDVIEIDAASRNKVEDIRDLREKVGYAPLEFPYKIYIIDEVHMVTPQGFNALLKTLEEPPEHVKFLFATTEPHKLPITILSRCIRFDFQRIPLDDLAKHLIWIAREEGFTMEMEAALLLSRLAEGSARDAISLLDQLTVYCTDTITTEAAQELFQLGDPRLPAQVLELLRADDRRELLAVWNNLVEQGADAGRFLVQISETLKESYLVEPDYRSREALAVMWESLNLLRFESFPALLVELSLLRCFDIFHGSADQQAQPVGSQQRVEPDQQQSRTAQPAVQRQHAEQRTVATQATAVSSEPPPRTHSRQTPPDAPFELAGDEHWTKMLKWLEQNSLTSFALVRLGVKPIPAGGSLLLEFEDSGSGRMAVRYALQPEHSAKLTAAARSSYGQDTLVTVKIAGEAAVVSLAEPARDGAAVNATIEPGGTVVRQPVTADDAIELFGATELKDGNKNES